MFSNTEIVRKPIVNVASIIGLFMNVVQQEVAKTQVYVKGHRTQK